MTSVTDNIAEQGTQAGAGMLGVRAWLFMLSGLIFLMIVVGGATRLTDSGLSITEWKPILGIVPPLSTADWQDAFQKYQQIPEYKRINKGMSLNAFKTIFWWEWGHRFLGRFIGFAVALPFLFFWLPGRIERSLIPRIIGMFVLGGLQGLLGWYMVMSGLVDRVDVSQYRLAAHLGLAFIIFAYIFWLALSVGGKSPSANLTHGDRKVVLSAVGLLVLLFVQVLLGAFVAGLDAGLSHNTWPLMDGAVVPNGLLEMSPWYLNIFENVATVQFNHRMVAYAVVLWSALHIAKTWKAYGEGPEIVGAALLFIAVIAQAALGIWTLLMQVPIDLGVMHQGGAVIVFAIALHQLHVLVRTPAQPAVAGTAS
ncbi:MAG: COX15/CtaA family protein [Methyloligellaceae bacterium]